MNAIEIKELHKSFGTKEAVKGLNLAIGHHELAGSKRRRKDNNNQDDMLSSQAYLGRHTGGGNECYGE